MKKPGKLTIAAISATFALSFGLTACGDPEAPPADVPRASVPEKEAEKEEKPKQESQLDEFDREIKDVEQILVIDNSTDYGDGMVVDDVVVEATVTNNSDKKSDYLIEFDIIDANGTRIYNDMFLVYDLTPGKTTVEELYTTMTAADVAAGVEIDVTDMDRTESL